MVKNRYQVSQLSSWLLLLLLLPSSAAAAAVPGAVRGRRSQMAMWLSPATACGTNHNEVETWCHQCITITRYTPNTITRYTRNVKSMLHWVLNCGGLSLWLVYHIRQLQDGMAAASSQQLNQTSHPPHQRLL